MRLVANVCLGLAVLLYAIVLPFVSNLTTPANSDTRQGEAFGLLLVLIALWFLLAIALSAGAATGALDWLSLGRRAQYALVGVMCLALLVVTWLSGMLRKETADQIPWSMGPLVAWGWSMWVFPLVVMLFCVLTINPELGAVVPRLALRTALGVVCGITLLASVGMLTEWFVSSQHAQQAHVEAIVAEGDERTQRQIAEVEALDVEKNLSQALGYTNRYNDPKVRDPALAKIRAVPNLEEQLAGGLRSEWCVEVLIFLDGADPPDKQPLVEPARDAFALLGRRALERTRDPEYLHPDSFDFDVRLMLSVADKFHGLGVDYSPEIRAYRSALNQPRQQKLTFNAAAMLDTWLAKDAKRTK